MNIFQIYEKAKKIKDEQRLGQRIWNMAFSNEETKEATEASCGTEFDCFYCDKRIPMFLKFVKEHQTAKILNNVSETSQIKQKYNLLTKK